MYVKQIAHILESFGVAHKVHITNEPDVEDHSITLDKEFHLQIGSQEQYLELIEELPDGSWSSVTVQPHEMIPIYRMARKIRDIANKRKK